MRFLICLLLFLNVDGYSQQNQIVIKSDVTMTFDMDESETRDSGEIKKVTKINSSIYFIFPLKTIELRTTDDNVHINRFENMSL